jgi:hypothetical protein
VIPIARKVCKGIEEDIRVAYCAAFAFPSLICCTINLIYSLFPNIAI